MRLVLSFLLISLITFDFNAQTFGPQQQIGISEAGILDVQALDVDGDNDRDFISISDLQQTIAWYELDHLSDTYTKHIIHRGLEDIQFMALADMDRDDDVDIVIAHGDTYGRVVMLANEGNGNFSEPVEYFNSYPIFEMKVMDIDYDNDIDIIVAQDAPSIFGYYAIAWHPNDEFGNIGASSILYQGARVKTFDIGQVNDDIYWDIVFASDVSHEVRILHGTGIGTFGNLTPIYLSSTPIDQVRTFDIKNGDGKDDILFFRPDNNSLDCITHDGSEYGLDDTYFFDSYVRLKKDTDIPNSSQGTYLIGVSTSLNTITLLFDSFGRWFDDIGVLEYQIPGYSLNFFLLPDSSSNFLDFVTYVDQFESLWQRRFDLLALQFTTNNYVSSSQTTNPTELFLGPILTDDGSVHLAVSSFTNSAIYDTPSILNPLINDEFILDPYLTNHLRSGDIDDDGDLDIVYIDVFGKLIVAFKEESWYSTFEAGQPTINNIIDFDLADINGDGDLDLVVSSADGPNGDRIFTLQYIGSQQFGGQISVDNDPDLYSKVLFTDLDGNGNPDIMIYQASGDNFAKWHENTGSGLYTITHNIDTPGFLSDGLIMTNSTIADMDGDGDGDLVCFVNNVQTQGRSLHWLENNGVGYFGADGSSQHHLIRPPIADSAWEIHAEDIDNDGDMDVIIGKRNSIELWERTGAESFESSTITTFVDEVTDLGTADVDDDGDMDLFSTSSNDGKVAWYENLTNDAAGCPEDINGDGTVNIDDFIQLNSAYGSSCNNCPADINNDGIVNIDDFIQLNSAYGSSCEGLVFLDDESSNGISIKSITAGANLSKDDIHPEIRKHLDNHVSDLDVFVYPIPITDGLLNILLPNEQDDSSLTMNFQILDLRGHLVQSGSLSTKSLLAGTQVRLNTDLSDGTYLLRLVSDEKQYQHKLVIQSN